MWDTLTDWTGMSGLTASQHPHCGVLYGRLRPSWLPVPAGDGEEAGPALGQGVQAGAADKPRPAQPGARKRDAGSQQDGPAPRRLHKPGWGPQQVLLLCLLQGFASLAWCDILRYVITAG